MYRLAQHGTENINERVEDATQIGLSSRLYKLIGFRLIDDALLNNPRFLTFKLAERIARICVKTGFDNTTNSREVARDSLMAFSEDTRHIVFRDRQEALA